MSIIKSIFGMFFLLLIVSLVLLIPATVTGSLLRFVFPSVDRGMSILIGLVTTVSSVHLITRFTMEPGPIRISTGRQAFVDEEDEEDGEDDDDESGQPPRHPPAWSLPPPERPSWKRRRRRR
jgi:hypothetical protein